MSAALKYLKYQIKSKGKESKYEDLTNQNYLVGDSDLTNQEKIEALKIRSKMVEVKTNMKNKNKNVFCVVCKKEVIEYNDTQKHTQSCHEIKSKQNKTSEVTESSDKYINIFKQKKHKTNKK